MSAAGNNAYMEHGYSSLTYDAITPMFSDISRTGRLPYFKIQAHQPDYEGSGVADHIQILYRASENDTWTLLHTFSAVYNNWAQDSIPLPSNLTYIQLNIRGVGMGPSADGCAFDDLSIYNENNPPSCFAPFSLNASNITASSVDLTWDSDSDGTLVLYYKASTDGDYSSVSGVTLTDGVYTRVISPHRACLLAHCLITKILTVIRNIPFPTVGGNLTLTKGILKRRTVMHIVPT